MWLMRNLHDHHYNKWKNLFGHDYELFCELHEHVPNEWIHTQQKDYYVIELRLANPRFNTSSRTIICATLPYTPYFKHKAKWCLEHLSSTRLKRAMSLHHYHRLEEMKSKQAKHEDAKDKQGSGSDEKKNQTTRQNEKGKRKSQWPIHSYTWACILILCINGPFFLVFSFLLSYLYSFFFNFSFPFELQFTRVCMHHSMDYPPPR